MTSKNGNNGNNGNGDPIGESVDKLLKLYDRIKQADDIKREPLDIPEWGVTVWVKSLSGDDRDAFEQWTATRRQEAIDLGDDASMRGVRARVAILCTTDETGATLFTEDDAEWLGKKSGIALDRIFTVADRLAGLTPAAQEQIRKNSPATPSDASPSG